MCHDQMVDDPEPIANPETEPRSEPIPDLSRSQSGTVPINLVFFWTSWQWSESIIAVTESRVQNRSGRQEGWRPKDIFYEERKKMTEFVYKKDSWLADYYLEERHHIWRLIIFIFAFE
jgi:hypothetical protein